MPPLGTRNPTALFLLVACGAVTTLGLGGCRTIGPVPGKVGLSAQKTAKVVAKGFTLRKYVRVTSLAAERGTGELLEVKLGLENVRSKDLWCDIQESASRLRSEIEMLCKCFHHYALLLLEVLSAYFHLL